VDSDKLFKLFDLLEQSFVGVIIRDSTWLFPLIEAFHLIGFAVLGGSVLLGDFRLMRFCLTSRPVDYVLLQTIPWFKFGILIMFLTGVPLFLSEAIKCYYSRAFWIKISVLILGIFFTFLLRNPLGLKLSSSESVVLKIIGLTSISLWAVVAGSGRWIGFS